MCGITHIRSGLVVDTDCPQGDQTGVDEHGNERVKNGGDEHDALAEEQENGEDGDDDVEIRDADFL